MTKISMRQIEYRRYKWWLVQGGIKISSRGWVITHRRIVESVNMMDTLERLGLTNGDM